MIDANDWFARLFEEVFAAQQMRYLGYGQQWDFQKKHRNAGSRAHRAWKRRRASGRS